MLYHQSYLAADLIVGRFGTELGPEQSPGGTPYGPCHDKTGLRLFANTKGADQPARTSSLISPIIIRVLESIISGLPSSEISIF